MVDGMDPREMLRFRELLDEAGVEYETYEVEFDGEDLDDPDDAVGLMCTASPDIEVDGPVGRQRCLRGFSCALIYSKKAKESNLLNVIAKGMDDTMFRVTAKAAMNVLILTGVIR